MTIALRTPRCLTTRLLGCAILCAASALPPALPPALRAQQPPARAAATAPDSALLAAVASLRARARVRADTGARTVLSGRYLGHDTDTLWMTAGLDGRTAVPLQRIRVLHVQRGAQGWPMAAVGAVVVGSLGFLVGGAACSDTGVSASSDCVLPAVFAGVVLGAVSGGIVGSLIPRYVRRYPPSPRRAWQRW